MALFCCSSLNTISCEACVLLAKCEFCVVQQACLCYVSNEHRENVQKDTRLGLDAETRNSIRVKTLINHNLWFKSPIIVSLTLSAMHRIISLIIACLDSTSSGFMYFT